VAVAPPPFVREGDEPYVVADLVADAGGTFLLEGAVAGTSIPAAELELALGTVAGGAPQASRHAGGEQHGVDAFRAHRQASIDSRSRPSKASRASGGIRPMFATRKASSRSLPWPA